MFRRIAQVLVVIVAALFLMVGFGFAEEAAAAGRNWGYYVGIGLAIGLSAIGTGIAQGRIGAAGIGAIAENRELFPQVLLLVVIPETLVIFGFVVAMILLGQ